MDRGSLIRKRKGGSRGCLKLLLGSSTVKGRCGWRESSSLGERITFWRCAFFPNGSSALFTVAPRNARNAHRRLGRENAQCPSARGAKEHLEEILSVRVARRVAQDHTVS